MRGIVFVFLAACSYGVLSSIVKLAYKAGFNVGDVTGIQALVGALFFWCLAVVQGVFKKKNTSLKKPLKVIMIVKLMLLGLPIGFTSLFYYQSVQYIPASMAILLLFQFTWMGLLAEAIANKQFPSKVKLLSLVLLFSGTTLAANVIEGGFEQFHGVGTLYGILAAISYSLFIWINGRVATDIPPVPKSKWMMTGATLLIFCVYFPDFLFNGALTNGLLEFGLPLALFGTIIPPLFFAVGVPRTGVGLASILSAVELPVAVCFSMFLLSEQVNYVQWLGVIIILIGIVLPNEKLVKRFQNLTINKASERF